MRMVLEDCEVMVVGATGWLGRVTLDELEKVFGAETASRVIAVSSRETVLSLAGGTDLHVWPMTRLEEIKPKRPLLVFHHAFLTKDKVVGLTPEDYMQANVQIREALMRLLSRCQIVGLIVPSSGAVYDYLKSPDAGTDAGIYGRCKLDDEEAFQNMGQREGFGVVIPRVFNLSGRYINKHSLYALSAIILDCLNSRDINIRSTCPVWRSYYAAPDLVNLTLKMALESGSNLAPIFDTCGLEIVEIEQLANRCMGLLGCGSRRIVRPAVNQEPNYYVGDSREIRRLEAHYDVYPQDLDRQILETADYLRDIK